MNTKTHLLKKSPAMRRDEFVETDWAEIEDFLAKVSFGFLATKGDSDYPSIVPLNFVWANGALYFHSSRIGQKIKELKANNAVTFCIADEVALIPSYFTSEKLACPATAFFRSVMVYGKAVFVDDLAGARHEAGDLLQAGRAFETVEALESVIDAPPARDPSRPVVFKSVGQALWDLAAARLAWSTLSETAR